MKLPNSKKVRIGYSPRHSEHNSLAAAFNSRILSGLGDCAWRIFYYAYSTFRGVRNPQDTNFPAQDEWFTFYANIEPKMSYGRISWPEGSAGDPEGANVANPFLAWIFGNAGRVTAPNGEKDKTYKEIHGYWSEPIRLGGLEVNPPELPEDDSGHASLNTVWRDSENQRGCVAYLKNYKYTSSPAQQQAESGQKEAQLLSLGIVAAARKHLRFVMESPSLGRYAPSFVPYVNGRGGIFRKKNAEKAQIGQAMFYYLSYFRGSEDQRARHNLTGNDVTTDGFDFETFFSRQFLLAPNYSSPRFEKDDAGSVKKDSLGNFLIKYDETGYPELYPESLTLSWTYPLQDASKLNIIKTANETLNNNDFLFKSGNGSEFNTNPNPSHDLNRFCLSSIFIQSSDIAVKYEFESEVLLRGFLIDMYVNGNLYETIPIIPDYKYKANRVTGETNENLKNSYKQYYIYQFNKIHYFEYPVKGKVSFRARGTEGVEAPTPQKHGTVCLGLKIPNVLDKFTILIKFAHVLEMKPSAADAYVIMRIATTEGLGENAGEMDPVGHFNSDQAKKVFKNYMKYGVAYNLSRKSLAKNDVYVSANPVYESARKFISSHIKMADRYSLVDYAIEQGRSVLYFKRYRFGMKKTGMDSFRGLGPSITQVGNRNMIGSATETFIPITQGKKYIVLDMDKSSSNYIIYVEGDEKISLKHGSIFIGRNYYYASYFSSVRIGIYELDGIITRDHVSRTSSSSIMVDDEKQRSPGAISNEWSMFMSYNLYHPSNSSAWKPEMYGDIMGALNARCLTSSYALENFSRTSKNVKLHLANVSWRQYDKPLVVESPSAYNYIEGANTNLQYAQWQDNNDYVEDFAASCPIYQRPYYIRSVTRVNEFDPKCDVIKVTMQGRLNALGGIIPGSFRENVRQWKSRMLAENIRTDENAIISYLLSMGIAHCKREVIGDVALDNQNFWAGNRPWGCCYPRFYFVKLIPYVSAGSVMYSDHYRQMEYYLRAMCNGFVNTQSELSATEIQTAIDTGDLGTKSVGGFDSAVGDYLFEDLMRDSYDNSQENRSAVRVNMSSGGGG